MKSTIQRQVLLLALLPAALIALVLTLYHTHTRLDTLERHTLEQARSIASQCAALAASGVATVDREAVRAAAQATLSQEQALVQVTIRDDDRRTLARASRERSDDLSSNALRTLTQPVVVGRRGGALRWSDPRMTVARDQPGQTIGEVEVVVDLTPLHGRERAILWESLGISGLTLLLTGALAFRIGGRVTGPIQRINETIERIRRGDLGARPARTAEGELGSLERGLSEMADAIEAQQTAMQARVDHKTTELESTLEALEHRNAELEESNLEAQAASAFKSRFLANISHEIRTPMNSIVGFAELLDGANLDAVELDYLENIRESARSLLGLLNGILDLSQIESGRMELEHVETDLNAVLVEVFHLFGPHALRKGVELYVHPVAETLARVYTDPLRLKQVLINFVSNAVKFTEEGSIDIAVEGTVDDDGHAHLRFAVADTGSGIPESAQTRLFQAFAQGRPRGQTSPEEGDVGTGLGLHIASEIVFLMDGSIEFASEPGYGTTFWLSATFEHAESPSPEPSREAPGAHLILLDPDTTSRHLYQRVLERAGYCVEAMMPEALVAASDPTGDLVMYHIPAQAIIEDRLPASTTELRLPGCPLCALAHAPQRHTRDQLLEAGFDEVIPKTPDTATLERALRPLVTSPAAVADDSRRTPAATSLPAPLRVLVIDDHPVNRRLFVSYIEDEQRDAVAVGASDEALYYIETQAFDAVLVDIHLPDRDGIATARAIRASASRNSAIPIIAITADAFQDQNERAMEAGINELLIKPVTRNQLESVLARWCHDDSGAGASHPSTSAAPAPDPSDATDSDRGPLPAYDHAQALHCTGGREDVALELFGVLQRSLPDTRARLIGSAQARDRDAVRSTAHSLRGAAAYCGVPRLSEAVARVEQQARHGEHDALWRAVDELIDAIDELAGLDEPWPRDQ